MDWKRLTASALMLGLLALPASAASITPQTTMKEIRDDPDIRASGLYTYTYVWERDCEKLSTSRDDETLAEVVDDTSAEACAAGLNYLAQVYHDGVQVTYPLYSEEEIAAMPSRAHVELYYCPAEQPGAKFAIVLSGNSLYYSGELRGGVSTAWELHQQGYAVFSLRYRIGLEAGDDAPMEDLARAIRLVLANADTFGVSTEDYALLGYSSGGQIAGVFGNEEKGWGRYGVPKPGALLLAYPINNFLEAKPAYHLLMDDETLAEVVDDTSAEACAAGLNYLAQVYHDGVQVTYPLYSEEEIAAMPSRAHVELYYCPAEQPGAKFAIVLSGNSLYYSGELRGGVSTAWELHQQGYAVFSLRYRIGLEAGDDAPMEDLARAIRLVLANADTFGVSTEDYALLGYSSGGQIAGVFGNEEKGWGRYGVPKPGALLLAYPINNFLEAKPAYHLLMDTDRLERRYYSYTVSKLVTPDYPPTFLWYGRNDKMLMAFVYPLQGPALAKALRDNGVPNRVQVYDDAKHGVGIGVGTDAEGWVADAAAFWKSVSEE